MEADVAVSSEGDTIGVVVVCNGGDIIGDICGERESIEDAPGE